MAITKKFNKILTQENGETLFEFHRILISLTFYFVEPSLLLSDEVVKPPTVSKATIQRCSSTVATDAVNQRWL